ncbi:MAG: hypothetical protein O3A29_17495 [Planctomycetota bacterium]|nr:hypothetical protein [Planctomycetota bacterium]
MTATLRCHKCGSVISSATECTELWDNHLYCVRCLSSVPVDLRAICNQRDVLSEKVPEWFNECMPSARTLFLRTGAARHFVGLLIVVVGTFGPAIALNDWRILIPLPLLLISAGWRLRMNLRQLASVANAGNGVRTTAVQNGYIEICCDNTSLRTPIENIQIADVQYVYDRFRYQIDTNGPRPFVVFVPSAWSEFPNVGFIGFDPSLREIWLCFFSLMGVPTHGIVEHRIVDVPPDATEIKPGV